MSAKTGYECDGCGKTVDAATASQFAGIHSGQTTVASGGVHAWHSCSAACAAKHLRSLADAVEARGEVLRKEEAAHAKDQATRATEQAKLRAKQTAEEAERQARVMAETMSGTRVPLR